MKKKREIQNKVPVYYYDTIKTGPTHLYHYISYILIVHDLVFKLSGFQSIFDKKIFALFSIRGIKRKCLIDISTRFPTQISQ